MTPRNILDFWFPADLGSNPDAVLRQVQWWFRGGSNDAVKSRFAEVLAHAKNGELEHWKSEARSRLALIIVLDQFSRAIHGQHAGAYRNDAMALALAREGLDCGHYAALSCSWERTFFSLPFGHSENLADAELAVELAERIAAEGPEPVRPILEFSASQARGHRDVIARFGRHPHRNALLGRESTPAEIAYLESGELVHQRPLPGGAP